MLNKLKTKLQNINPYDVISIIFIIIVFSYIICMIPWAIEKEAEYELNKQIHYMDQETERP